MTVIRDLCNKFIVLRSSRSSGVRTADQLDQLDLSQS